jgi:hypothetical protein
VQVEVPVEVTAPVSLSISRDVSPFAPGTSDLTRAGSIALMPMCIYLHTRPGRGYRGSPLSTPPRWWYAIIVESRATRFSNRSRSAAKLPSVGSMGSSFTWWSMSGGSY